MNKPAIEEILERTTTGEPCVVKEWDVRRIPKAVRGKLEQYGLKGACNPANPVNTDGSLADRVLQGRLRARARAGHALRDDRAHRPGQRRGTRGGARRGSVRVDGRRRRTGVRPEEPHALRSLPDADGCFAGHHGHGEPLARAGRGHCTPTGGRPARGRLADHSEWLRSAPRHAVRDAGRRGPGPDAPARSARPRDARTWAASAASRPSPNTASSPTAFPAATCPPTCR